MRKNDPEYFEYFPVLLKIVYWHTVNQYDLYVSSENPDPAKYKPLNYEKMILPDEQMDEIYRKVTNEMVEDLFMNKEEMESLRYI
jgi:hypothetical protein